MTQQSVPAVAMLPTAIIMANQPETVEDAETLLDLIFANPYYAHKPEGERAMLRRYLNQNGLPEQGSYTVFAITHNGTRVDFELKCLLLMGMVRLAHAEGDLTENQVKPFIRNIAELYMHFGLRDDDENNAPAPETLRVQHTAC